VRGEFYQLLAGRDVGKANLGESSLPGLIGHSSFVWLVWGALPPGIVDVPVVASSFLSVQGRTGGSAPGCSVQVLV